MTPTPSTIDLSTLDDEDAAKLVCAESKNWAEAIASQWPNCDPTSLRLLIDEFAKNSLHGDNAVVHLLPLPDGSYLVMSVDEPGNDHISEGCSAHVGSILIRTLAGNENYRILLEPDSFRGFLHIVPGELAAI